MGQENTSPSSTRGASGCGHLFIALDPAAFGDPDGFLERMDQLIDEVKSVPLAPGFGEVYIPGEIEARAERENAARGLSLPHQTLHELRELAASTGVPPLASEPPSAV